LTPSDYNGYNISCFGSATGSINLTITGGTPPLIIIWSNAATTEDLSNVPAGYYRVTVDDADTLTDALDAEITLTEPERLEMGEARPYVYQNGYNVSAFGACNGSIILDVKGGVAPYTYLWEPGQQTTGSPTNLCSNDNQVVVTDANGCIIVDGIGLNEPQRDDWTMMGNSNSNPATQFIGTLDNKDLVFKTNNTESARLKANGEFSIARIKSGRIVSPDSLIYFGDSTIIMHPSLNRLYGDDASAGWKGTAIGKFANAPGLYSTSLGYKSASVNPYSVAIGFRVQTTQDYSIAIGNGTSGQNLTNNFTNTIMLGCNSNVPTVFISSASGQNTSGNVGIGTTDIPNGFKLAVNGRIIATELKIKLKNLWPPDYVFEKNYHLMSIPELKQFIEKHKHLPEIPSANEMLKNGVNTAELLMGLLKNLEELTLHVIQQQEEIEALKANK